MRPGSPSARGAAGEIVMGMEMAEGGKICLLLHGELIDELRGPLGNKVAVA